MVVRFKLRVKTDLLFCVTGIYDIICVVVIADGSVVGFRFEGRSDWELILGLVKALVCNMNYVTPYFRLNV